MRALFIVALAASLVGCTGPAPSTAHSRSKTALVDAGNAAKSANVAKPKYSVTGRIAPLPPAQRTTTAKSVTEKAKSSIAAMMANPASAEFYNLERAVKKLLDEPVDTICGYVKGKNATGGDTEEMPFLYIIRGDRHDEAYLVDGRSYVAQTVHGVLCK
jgi:hypothetical protein